MFATVGGYHDYYVSLSQKTIKPIIPPTIIHPSPWVPTVPAPLPSPWPGVAPGRVGPRPSPSPLRMPPAVVCTMVASPGANMTGRLLAPATSTSSGLRRGFKRPSHDGREKSSSIRLVTEMGTSKIV